MIETSLLAFVLTVAVLAKARHTSRRRRRRAHRHASESSLLSYVFGQIRQRVPGLRVPGTRGAGVWVPQLLLRARTWWAALFLMFASVLGVYGYASAAEGFAVTMNSGSAYFTPDGDGQEDRMDTLYCLTESALVDVEVLDSQSRVVRTIDSGIARSGSSPCWWYSQVVSWDGTTDDGRVVADGEYRIRVTATNGEGETAEAFRTVGVFTGQIGALERPEPESTIGGDAVAWRFEPGDDVAVQSLYLYCQPSLLARVDSVSGTHNGTFDSNRCNSGANGLYLDVYWQDDFGYGHWWRSPTVPVTVSNAPTVSIQSGERYFSPDGDSIDDSSTVYYCLTKKSSVVVSIEDASGREVRRLTYAEVNGVVGCYYYATAFEWDGKNEAGDVVANGVYTATVTATDAEGRTGEATRRIGVEVGTRGQLVTPAEGAEISGNVAWVFKPAENVAIQRVYVGCPRNPYSSQQTTPDADGTYRGEFDSVPCGAGEVPVIAYVEWSDGFNNVHYWTTSNRVTLTNAPTINLRQRDHAFTPDDDGPGDRWYTSYCLNADATVTSTVRDAAGRVVRTLEEGIARSGGCSYYSYGVEWDGRDGEGELQPDGRYTFHIEATGQRGDKTEESAQIALITSPRGAFVTPKADDTVNGDIAWQFRPAEGVDVRGVYVRCENYAWLSTDYSASADGLFEGTASSRLCNAGANRFQAYVDWVDEFGQSQQSWITVPVTIANDLEVRSLDGDTYFTPDGDGYEDTYTPRFCLSENASVQVTIENEAGVVRRLDRQDDATGTSNCGYYQYSPAWDGKDEDGEDVPAGAYTVRIRAENGSRTAEATNRVGVDRGPFGTVLRPGEGSTLSGLSTFEFKPRENVAIQRVYFCLNNYGCFDVPAVSAAGTWKTTIPTGSLPQGETVLRTYLYWQDPFGNSNHIWYAPDTNVTVDNNAIALSVTPHGLTGPAPLAATLDINASDPRGGTLNYTVNWGDGTTGTGEIAPPYTQFSPTHTYNRTGVFVGSVSVRNASGSTSSSFRATVTGAGSNTPPTAQLRVDPVTGVAPLKVQAEIGGTDAENNELSYTLDFGDGTAREAGRLPRTEVAHTYARPGTYITRLVVSDGKASDARTAIVRVAPDAPLGARAGDDQSAVVNTAVQFDGSASTPSAGIEAYRWAFGDGTTGEGARVEHTYTEPGTYTAKLTVQMNGELKTDEVTVTVTPVPREPGLKITVTDGSSPLGSANVQVQAADGKRFSAVTAATGEGVLQLPDGEYTVYAWKQGYVPASGQATVKDGSGELTLTVTAGRVATSELTSEPLTREEIIEAGIDPDDPVNQNVYEFEVHIALDPLPGQPAPEPLPLTGITNGTSFPACPAATDGSVEASCGGGGGTATFEYAGSTVTMAVHLVDDKPEILWLIVPGKAKWLKEFFQVQMLVTNLAPDPFNLDQGTATLTLPEGLALAPLTPAQSTTVSVPRVAGGASQAATWIVRGDKEGEYTLSADYAGVLEPIGEPLTMHAELSKPLKVWGGSALKMDFEVDETAHVDQPYYATVRLTNVADVPIYNASVELLPNPDGNYIFQPLQERTFSVAELKAGATVEHEYILVPEVSGVVDLEKSFVVKTGGNSYFPIEIKTHPVNHHYGGDYDFTVTPLKAKAGLTWEPLPASYQATGYKVFMTPKRNQEFGTEPVQVDTTVVPTKDGHLRAIVRDLVPHEAVYFAISTVVDGRTIMLHPLRSVTPLEDAREPVASISFDTRGGSGTVCLADGEESRNVRVTYRYSDEFGLRSYRFSHPAATEKTLDDGPTQFETQAQDVVIHRGEKLRLSASAVGISGDAPAATEEVLTTGCAVKDVVVLASGLTTSLEPGEASVSQPVVCPDRARADGWLGSMATNGCDGRDGGTNVRDVPGNLLDYFTARGFVAGASRSAPNRTLLEFSYNGADVDCYGAGGVTFVPRKFTSEETIEELGNVLIKSNAKGADFFDALARYRSCWQERYGTDLRYTLVGHSLGGYESLGILEEALRRRNSKIIANVVTVDGAVKPEVIVDTISIGQCGFKEDDWRRWVGDAATVALRLDQRTGRIIQRVSTLARASGPTWARDVIREAQAAGVKVATTTNTKDGCLLTGATIEDESAHRRQWTIDTGGTGINRHSAALNHHNLPTEMPGYPLADFLDALVQPSVPAANAANAAKAADAAKAAKAARVSASAAGTITGRLVRSGTTQPDDGQVTVVGAGVTRGAQVADDGTFTVANLPDGDYRVYAWSSDPATSGTWIGGTSAETARTFAVAGPTAIGDISAAVAPKVRVTLLDPAGKPVKDAVAALLDDERVAVVSGSADENGMIQLSAPAGGYRLTAGSLSTDPVEQALELNGDQTVTLELKPGAVVTAVVKDKSGNPVPGALVQLKHDGEIVDVGFTDARGEYRFLGHDPATYVVSFAKGFSAADISEVELPVTPVTGDPAAGTVTYATSTAPVITSAAPPASAELGKPFSFAFTASGSPAPEFTLGQGELPKGLTLKSDGSLTGNPTQAGKFSFTVKATNSAGSVESDSFTITMADPEAGKPVITSGAPPAADLGTPYSFTVTATGDPAPTFAVASGALPDGLTLASSGEIAGTPTRAGDFTFTVKAVNDKGNVTSGPLKITVAARPSAGLKVDVVVSADFPKPSKGLTSPKVTTTGDRRLLVAFVAANQRKENEKEQTSVSGGGLTWKRAVNSSVSSGAADIWQAWTDKPFSDVVTAMIDDRRMSGSITVVAFEGAASAAVSTGKADGNDKRPQVALTAKKAGSQIWAVGHDAKRPVAHVVDPGQSMVHEFLDDSNKETFWVQRLTDPTTKTGPVTMGATVPEKGKWQMAAVEIAVP